MITVAASPATTTTLPKRNKRQSHDQEIRARLLNRLGIYDAQPSVFHQYQQPTTAAEIRRLRILRGMGVGYAITPSTPDTTTGNTNRPPLGGVIPQKDKLKYSTDEPRNFRNKNSNNSNSSTTKRRPSKKIAFDDEVTVIAIPMRNEYSERVRSRIWSNRFELQENAQRNAVEFAAEGWNWRNVTVDEEMYICSVSGELVHPVHCQHLATSPSQDDEEDEQPMLQRGAPVHS